MKKKIITVMLFAVIVVMMLSACGNSTEPSGSAEESYYPDGSIQTWTEYEYDADGRVIKYELY